MNYKNVINAVLFFKKIFQTTDFQNIYMRILLVQMKVLKKKIILISIKKNTNLKFH
jgi:hypothetical protein